MKKLQLFYWVQIQQKLPNWSKHRAKLRNKKTPADHAASLGKATNEIDFYKNLSSDEEKDEQLKDKIMESFKLNA